MLQLTQRAAITLDEIKRQQQIPEMYGIRLWAESTSKGDLGVRVTFTDAPAEHDVVDEQHGIRLFVAEEVVEPLADTEIDVRLSVRDDGDEAAAELVLRPQNQTDEG